MADVGLDYQMSYRCEIAAPLFDRLRSGEAAVLVGLSSMGKSRLVRWVLRSDTRQQYLGEQAAETLLVLVDCHRLAEVSDWGLWELLLTSLVEAAPRHPRSKPLRDGINALRREAITSRDALLARRHTELAVQMLCQEHNLRLVFLLDEFDTSYRNLPATTLSTLRAMRDAHKYRLSYVLTMRETPERLRPVDECQGFYELVSRSIIGVGPYKREDATRMIHQLEERYCRELPDKARPLLVRLSGGHPGLIVAMFDVLAQSPNVVGVDVDWALQQPAVGEECRKLWGSLADDERLALLDAVQGVPIVAPLEYILRLKGLLSNMSDCNFLFSPIFQQYVLTAVALKPQSLRLDEAANVAWVGRHAVPDLTRLEFDLLKYLFHRAGEVCTRDQILTHLYPEEMRDSGGGLQDSRVDALVKRVREKIEPLRRTPRYLLTVRGKGYKLIMHPSNDESV